jgi:branched-chain amino acid transport system substrate-binding protein
VKRLVVAVLAGACAGLGCGSPRPARVIVGVGMAPYSQSGVKLATDEINAAGGIGGVRVELAGTDWVPRFSPPEVLRLATRFNSLPDLVAVIGHDDSAATLSAAASYNRDGIPQIVTIATNPAITNIGVWTYRLCLSDKAQGPALAAYAVRGWNKRRIAMIYVNDDYGRGLARPFEERVRALGAEVVASVVHRNILEADDEATVQAGIAEIRASKADMVALFDRVDPALWILKAFRRAGLSVDVLGGDNLAQARFPRAPDGLTEGVRVSQFLDLDPAGPLVAKFIAGIRAATGSDPDYAQAYAYDAMHLVGDAVRGGGYSRAGVKSYLDRVIASRQPIHGVTGTYVLGADHDARRPLYVSVVEHGRFRKLQALAVE